MDNTLQHRHEQRLDRFLVYLQRHGSPDDLAARVVWYAIRSAAIRIGCTVDEAEAYADRWWLDGGF